VLVADAVPVAVVVVVVVVVEIGIVVVVVVVEVVVVVVVGCKSWGGVELGCVLSWGFGSVGGSVEGKGRLGWGGLVSVVGI